MGLGGPVLQYLAGAGVGYLGIVDADTLDASNLHRQPIYALAEVGEKKTELALAAVKRINPTVHVEAHAVRLDANNALSLIRGYDVVVDCSDNFLTKFLINDAAVLAQRPAVFASVYQFEGQLQVYKPESRHACLRCLWPDAVADGVVGNCAEAGVLGPVPGAFGTLQAVLTLKILLGLSGQLDGVLWLLDFTNFSALKLKAPRRAGCRAPGPTHIRDIPREDLEIRVDIRSLSDAVRRGFKVIDIHCGFFWLQLAPTATANTLAMAPYWPIPARSRQGGNFCWCAPRASGVWRRRAKGANADLRCTRWPADLRTWRSDLCASR